MTIYEIGSSGITVPGISVAAGPWVMVPDQTGGAIFAGNIPGTSPDGFADITAQRISGNGQVIWGAGLLFAVRPGIQANPQLLEDGDGGVFVAWEECPVNGANCHIRAQRLSSSGANQWAATGMMVSSAPNTQTGPGIVSDGSGGIVIAWRDCRNYTLDECFAEADIYAQRINGSGQSLWQESGIPISVAARNQGIGYVLVPPFVVQRDGQGGYLFAWPDGRVSTSCRYRAFPSRCHLFAQRFR